MVEVLNPLARDYKSIGTMKKELAELQEELAQAHRQVLIVSSCDQQNMKLRHIRFVQFGRNLYIIY